MRVYLGLGSNLGDRREHLSRAIDALEADGATVARVSPVVESPALLPDSAPSEWNLPYLNLVLECTVRCTPEQLRARIDEIQRTFGRHGTSRWSPRPIDIDILLWGRERIETERLTIPHRDMTCRSFVLAPLAALAPRLTVPGRGERTVLEWSMALDEHIPLWMGIVNVTPDSFSDGGRFVDRTRIEPHVAAMVDAGVHILDVGGESTRPGATPVDPATEWSRVGPVLERLIERSAGREAASPAESRHPSPRGGGEGPGARRGHHQRRRRTDLPRHGRAGERQRQGLGGDAPRHRAGRPGGDAARRPRPVRRRRAVAAATDGSVGRAGARSRADHLRPRDRLRQEPAAVAAAAATRRASSAATVCACWWAIRASPS